MTTDFRALCAELVETFKDENTYTQRVEALDRARAALATSPPEPKEVGDAIAYQAYIAFVQICKGNSDDAGTYEEDEALVRCALKRLDKLESALTALATPQPKPPTDEELLALEEKLWHEYKRTSYQGYEFMYEDRFRYALRDYRAVLERKS